MRYLPLALVVLAACKDKAPPPPPAPAAVSVAVPSAIPSTSAAPVATVDTRPLDDSLPIANETVELVAEAKSPETKLKWLALHGDRMWLETESGAAFAVERGKLESGADPLSHFPKDEKASQLKVVGTFPRLYALRYSDKAPASPEVLIHHAGAAAGAEWEPAKALPDASAPVALVAYRDGAALVQAQNVDGTTIAEPLTRLTFIGPDGAVSPLATKLDPLFIAQDADSDATGISLIGAHAVKRDTPPLFAGVGARVVQLGGDAEPVTTVIHEVPWKTGMDPLVVHRNAGFTTASVPKGMLMQHSPTWPDVTVAPGIPRDGKTQTRNIKGHRWCWLEASRFIGSYLYGVRTCRNQAGRESTVLARVDPANWNEAVLFGERCSPTDIVAGFKDELWVVAKCGDDDHLAIFRERGPKQKPVAL